MDAVLWLAAGAGHLAVWCWIFNRIHATACPRFYRKVIEWLVVGVVLLPVVVLSWKALRGESLTWQQQRPAAPIFMAYASACAVAFTYFATMWWYRRVTYRVPPGVRRRGARVIDVRQHVDKPLEQTWLAKALSWVPGNQATQVSLEESELAVLRPGLPLAGFRICHLSDFHLTGALARRYYEFVIERVNDWQPDLIVLTGDFVDEPHCLEWIMPLLGNLQSRHGVYYVLGNHDRRVREERLRGLLEEAGAVAAAGIWHEIALPGAVIRIAGNERPWYPRASPVRADAGRDEALVLALMHSPDQREWALRIGADLAFAGHLHGGQICLPVVGPIIAPSRDGVKYVAEFHQLSRGLLIVSRGLAGDEPIRWRCPPQAACYELHPAN